MKKNKKSILVIMVILLILIVRLGVYYTFQYDFDHVTQVDTSFLTEKVKWDLKKIAKDCLQNTTLCETWNLWETDSKILKKYNIFSLKKSAWMKNQSKKVILLWMRRNERARHCLRYVLKSWKSTWSRMVYC